MTDAISAEAANLINKLKMENAELVKALRGYAIVHGRLKINWTCELCSGLWKEEQPESHAPNCLAAIRKDEG